MSEDQDAAGVTCCRGAGTCIDFTRWTRMKGQRKEASNEKEQHNPLGTLALSLFASGALVAMPATTATAKSIQQDGYFGGTWEPIGPKYNRHVKRYHRQHDFYARGYYGPRYGYYGPRYGYYGPSYGYDGGPGLNITIR